MARKPPKVTGAGKKTAKSARGKTAGAKAPAKRGAAAGKTSAKSSSKPSAKSAAKSAARSSGKASSASGGKAARKAAGKTAGKTSGRTSTAIPRKPASAKTTKARKTGPRAAASTKAAAPVRKARAAKAARRAGDKAAPQKAPARKSAAKTSSSRRTKPRISAGRRAKPRKATSREALAKQTLVKPAARKPARKRPAKPRAAAKAPTADRLKAKPAGANGGKTARSRIVARASTKAKPPLLRETARRRVEKETAPRPQKPPVPARAAPFRLHALGVRDEHATDRTQIEALLTQAFGRSDEARDLEQWRADGRVVCALVAEYEGEIIGHVAIVSAEAQLDGRALKAAVLAPPAVLPSRQGRGIGSVLLSSALEAARTAGYEALFATGDAAYHQRFGFSAETARPFESGVNAPLLALELKPGALWGVTGAITALARSAR